MSKVLLYFFIGLFVLYFSYGAGNYPVSSQINKNFNDWGEMTPISAEVLPQGLPLTDVEEKLREENFIKDEDAVVVDVATEKKPNHFKYSKDVSTLVCKERMYVDVQVNENLQLVSASGTIREFGCL